MDGPTGRTRIKTSTGASFAIELDEGVVLTDNIQVTAPFKCNANRAKIVLMVFDKTNGRSGRWIRASKLCTEAPPAPTFSSTACEAVFEICHLTQFAVGEIVAEEQDSTDEAPSGVVSGDVDGGSTEAEDEDKIKGGYIAVIVLGAMAVVIAGTLVAWSQKKRGSKTKAVDVEQGQVSFESETAEGPDGFSAESSAESSASSVSSSASSGSTFSESS